ncbi:outer membrane beta-barrel protein [Mucilaginibacter sp. SP1R1]|uniref:outer membrane beta-barrel protein n=1 Tax=Mucilaginibacter sp. SP1R1 TaxID=2723091 RepID=UPI00160E9702|nr:outer membrane beta-barrel protein [Mucilaginibacter sp. SP1R1]MBB6152751.1 hypothetical protein [Mucilaginibacter sp. SP1R1]
MKIIFFLLLCCLSAAGFAQTRATIKGRVIDSLNKSPLELSTVAAVDASDSTLIAYVLSRKNGEFELHGLPAEKKVKLVVSFASYKSYIHLFTFKKGETTDLGAIALSTKMLNEIVVRAERIPITIKKDTIEFDAAAFKTRPNAVVEELLKKLPGVQVNGDGSITVNGKAVSKLLIDGKEFFGTDPKIATRNLDADIVAQIQVYDDRQNDPDHLISETKVAKIINIKLKKAIKRSIFGKIYAGGGTRDRYESGGLFNIFRDTLQLSVIGLSNNLNRTAFSNDELYSQGGFNRGGGDALYNGSLSVGGNNWGGNGIEKVTSGGFNLNTDYGKKLKINLLYFYTQKNTSAKSVSRQQQFLGDTTIISSGSYTRQANSYSHSVSGLIDWNPDTLRNLRYTPRLTLSSNEQQFNGLSDSRNNFNTHLNTVNGSSDNNTTSTQFQQSFYYNKRFKNKPRESFTISNNLQINPNHGRNFNNNDVISFLPTVPSDTLHRFAQNKSANTSGDIGLSYRYPISKKLVVDITTSGNYNKSSEQLFTYDRNNQTGIYDIFLANQSTNLSRDQWTENAKPGITYQLTKGISVIAGLNTQWQQIQNNFTSSRLNQKYFFLLPTFRIDAGGFSASYESGVNQPSVSSLQPITIVYNSLYSYTGNPLLVPSRTTSGSLSYYTYKQESQISFNTYAYFSKAKNTEVTKQTIKTNGAQTSTPVNRDGRASFNMSATFGKQFKKTKDWQTGMSTSVYGYYNPSLNLLNDVEGWQNTLSTGFNQNFNINWKDKVELTAGAGFRQTDTKYEYNDFRKVNTNSFTLNNNLLIRFPKKIIWETKQDYVYSSQISPGFRKGVNVVSSSLALQMLKKDRGELKFTVYDVFNQNISVFRFTGTNAIYDMQNNTLKRYFLLTYTVKFNKLSTK